MFVDYGAYGFEFHDQTILHQKVGKKLAEQCAIFIQHLQRVLLDHEKPGFS